MADDTPKQDDAPAPKIIQMPDVLDANNVSGLVVPVGLFLLGMADDERDVIGLMMILVIRHCGTCLQQRNSCCKQQVFRTDIRA